MLNDLLHKIQSKTTEPIYKLKQYHLNVNRFYGHSVAVLIEHKPSDGETLVINYSDLERTYYEKYTGPDYVRLDDISDEVHWLAVKAIDEFECQTLDSFLVYVQTGKKVYYDTSKCIHIHCMVGNWKDKELLCIPFIEKGAEPYARIGSYKL